MFPYLKPAHQCGNRLLAMLPADDYQMLQPLLKIVQLDSKQVICERNKQIEYIYFPNSSVLSVITYMQNGTGVEVGTIGNEGFFGIEVLTGCTDAIETTVCQVPGESLRMPVADFKAAIDRDTPLRRITQRYLQAYLSLVSQSVACNRLHTIEERFSRWVLMTHDRVQGDEFHLTQEFLADMLGVHRPSVSLVASSFQQAGLISYSRGNMKILKRKLLEETSCECYSLVKDQFNRRLGSPNQ